MTMHPSIPLNPLTPPLSRIAPQNMSNDLQWKDISSEISPTARYKHAACLISKKVPLQQKMALFGGSADSVEESNRLVENNVYILQRKRWEILKSVSELSCPSLVGHSMIYRDLTDELVVFGGEMMDYSLNPHIYTFNLNLRTWTVKKHDMGWPEALSSHGAYYHSDSDCMYIFGGKTTNDVVDCLWKYSFGDEEWEKISENNGPKARCSFAISGVGDMLYIHGGTNEKQIFHDFWKFDTSLTEWTLMENISGDVPDDPSSHSMVLFNDEIYMWLRNCLYILDMRVMDWRVGNFKTEFNNNVSERVGNSLVLFPLEEELILFGGFTNSGALNSTLVLSLRHHLQEQEDAIFPLVSLEKKPDFQNLQSEKLETASSLVSRYLSDKVWNQCKDCQTRYKNGFDLVINAAVQNLSTPVGAFAPDEYAYETFSPLFDKIIDSLQFGYKANDLHQSNFDISYYKGENPDPENEFIISTRMSVQRNLKGFPFSVSISKKERQNVEKTLVNLLKNIERSQLNGTYLPILQIDEKLRNQLIQERILFSQGNKVSESAGINRDWAESRGVYLSHDKHFSAWINEEDHLELMSIEDGSSFRSIFQRLILAINALSDKVEFAYSSHLGYLTTSPENLGTGLKVSVVIRLKHICHEKNFNSWLSSRQLQVRQVNQTQDLALSSGIFEVRNLRTLGISEIDIVQSMHDNIIAMISWEKELQQRMANTEEVDLNEPFPTEPPLDNEEYFDSEPIPIQQEPGELKMKIPRKIIEQKDKIDAERIYQSSPNLLNHYHKYCKIFHVKPNSYIEEKLQTKMFCQGNEIDLSSTLCGDIGIKPVMEVIRQIPNVQNLNLSFNGIRNNGVDYVSKVCTVHPSIQSINLSKNEISLTGAESLIRMVQGNKNITSINLTQTRIEIKNKLRINTFMQQNKEKLRLNRYQ